MTTNTIGYELFVPAIAAIAFPKKKREDQLNEGEFKQLVAVTFRDSIIEFMKDSLLYTVDIPIDVYKDVDTYDIIPPTGYVIEDVKSFLTNKVNIPKYILNGHSLILSCKPTKDIYSAFYIRLAVSPKRSSGICEFDEDFIEQYYDVILCNMKMKFADMTVRNWRSFGSVDRHRRDYNNKLNKVRRQSLNSGGLLKLKSRRLSNG